MSNQQKSGITEPLGIVVSDGGYTPEPTRFSAFVWGPDPDDTELLPSIVDEHETELVAH